MRIVVAGSKGGCGRTTVASSLALSLARSGRRVTLVEGSAYGATWIWGRKTPLLLQEEWTLPGPSIRQEDCLRCFQCQEFCAFDALVQENGSLRLCLDLCCCCGGCLSLCPQQAIEEIPYFLGTLKEYSEESLRLCLLQPQSHRSLCLWGMLAQFFGKKCPGRGAEIIDIPVQEEPLLYWLFQQCDCALLVTEPTPPGLTGLRRLVALARACSLPVGVLLNYADLGDRRIHEYCERNELALLLEIPFAREVAQAGAEGQPLVAVRPEFGRLFCEVMCQIEEEKLSIPPRES